MPTVTHLCYTKGMSGMGKPTGLVKRKGIYYYRQRWPKRYLNGENRNDFWRSLETSEYQIAVERILSLRVEADHYFQRESKDTGSGGIRPTTQRTKRPDNPSLPVLQPLEVKPLVIAFFQDAMKEMDANPYIATEVDKTKASDFRDELNDRRLLLMGVPGNHYDDPISGLDDYILFKNGFRCALESEAGQLLYEYLRRASFQLNEIRRARFDGDFSDRVTDSLFKALQPGASSAPSIKNITIGEAAEEYSLQLSKGGLNQKSMDRYKNELKHIVGFFGSTLAMSSIDAKSCDKFKETFTNLPPNFQKKLQELDIDYTALSAKAQDRWHPISWATLAKYLSQLDRFFEWASKRDYLTKNYAAGLQPSGRKPRGSTAKLPFDSVELARLFSQPIYTGCVDDTYGCHKIGSNIIRRSRYWAPLIALYSGLRSGEILQLTPAHFRISPNGNHFIVLTPDMSLKNDNAQREIPVHSVLQKIGLVEWIGRRSNMDGRLFPEIEADKFGSLSSPFSKRFKTDLEHLALGARRPKLTFHSFRHTFKRALDHADVIEEKKEEICGWARETKTARRYGDGLVADQLKDEIEKVDYGLDLHHLFNHSYLRD